VAEFHACQLAEATRKPKGGRRAALAPPAVALGVSGLASAASAISVCHSPPQAPDPPRTSSRVAAHVQILESHSCRRGRATPESCERPRPLALLTVEKIGPPSAASSGAVSSSQRFLKTFISAPSNRRRSVRSSSVYSSVARIADGWNEPGCNAPDRRWCRPPIREMATTLPIWCTGTAAGPAGLASADLNRACATTHSVIPVLTSPCG
jgi:hypothetical protein